MITYAFDFLQSPGEPSRTIEGAFESDPLAMEAANRLLESCGVGGRVVVRLQSGNFYRCSIPLGFIEVNGTRYNAVDSCPACGEWRVEDWGPDGVLTLCCISCEAKKAGCEVKYVEGEPIVCPTCEGDKR